MLRKIIIITILFASGGWGIARYFEIENPKTFKRVFSSVKIADSVKVNISSIDIVEETNKERISIGLPPLSINDQLSNSASLKVDDMINGQYFDHISPSGEGVSDLGSKVGYEYVIMGENLALGEFVDAKDIVNAWMNSPGHKANILSQKYKEIGVSVKYAKYQGKNVWFAVQHFGTSRSACPIIDLNLKKEIDSLNRELKMEEGTIETLKQDLQSPGAQNQPTYESSVYLFNSKVDAYNNKLNSSREKINFYNDQVRKFNTCIATFQ